MVERYAPTQFLCRLYPAKPGTRIFVPQLQQVADFPTSRNCAANFLPHPGHLNVIMSSIDNATEVPPDIYVRQCRQTLLFPSRPVKVSPPFLMSEPVSLSIQQTRKEEGSK